MKPTSKTRVSPAKAADVGVVHARAPKGKMPQNLPAALVKTVAHAKGSQSTHKGGKK